ncbi:MAG: hypothetical protein CME62_12175 [Halobacteriovoraceae bacterium]|nr:hypothetical protein [Halobacteriovoraceae bacterium]|tara:strand:+ start:2029 stop:2436 length:408 start_codon:yes stop_codon:yes gene_type:complete
MKILIKSLVSTLLLVLIYSVYAQEQQTVEINPPDTASNMTSVNDLNDNDDADSSMTDSDYVYDYNYAPAEGEDNVITTEDGERLEYFDDAYEPVTPEQYENYDYDYDDGNSEDWHYDNGEFSPYDREFIEDNQNY